MEFATRTIENRLRAPVPLAWIVVERIFAAASRGLVTAVLMVPVGALVLGELSWRAAGLPAAFGYTVLGALAGGAAGVTIGSLVSPARIGLTFSLVMPPLLFTGSAQFPFPELAAVPWFRALTPQVAHLPAWALRARAGRGAGRVHPRESLGVPKAGDHLTFGVRDPPRRGRLGFPRDVSGEAVS
ncbi:hypothetical protein [Amycolatopsis sp. lyj-108]|uniref:hypothetical protein n=1 Tax=Amycolatopsis sp. lyj-108 TaxID=2789286 RepID=UPI0039799B6A